MKPIVWLCAALLELPGCLAPAALRPEYGGALRVYLRARIADADPANWPSSAWDREAKTRILEQVYEPLVTLDDTGKAAPALASSWQSESGFRRWTFALRAGVVFHDGTPLTAAAAAGALTRLGDGFSATASGDSVVVRCERPAPGLLAQLALPRNWIWKRTADGAVFGTGPFRLGEWEASTRATLLANEEHWGGRPFLDSIRFEVGKNAREQRIGFELGRADVVELAPADFRQAAQRGAATWSSPPREVIALDATGDRLREALALAIDRGPIHSVLLGRQGEMSGALLPQWLSGYAFLFEGQRDLQAARAAAARLPEGPVRIGYDAADTVARAIAERIAVDARQAGVTAQASGAGGAEARVVRLRIVSTDPVTALRELGATVEAAPGPPYEMERAFLASGRLLPLFHVPDLFALSAQVRQFSWRLADVWLEPARP